MELEKKIVLAEPDEVFRGFLQSTAEAAGFLVAGSTGSGLEALELVRRCRPALLVMEPILPELDGFSLLRLINAELGIGRPQTILLTSFSAPQVTAAAREAGVFYLMRKPCTPASVLEWMLRACGQVEAPVSDESLKKLVSELLLELGIPASVAGYHYLREAILICVKDPFPVKNITKKLYPMIARRFGTTWTSVERSIRHAIETAWDRGELETLQHYFGSTVSRTRGRPTNWEFISTITDRLQLQLNSRWA